MKKKKTKKRKLNLIQLFNTAMPVFILLFCEIFFFRNIILDSNALIGDRGDGRLTTLIAEHWWNFFNGKEKFSELLMFYPVKGVIGYSDMFLGYGILHSLLRLFGMNMFMAYKWTCIITHFVGTASTYYLLKVLMKERVCWAVFGTMAFSFSDTLARHYGHTQLGAVSYLPVLLICLICFFKKFEIRKWRNTYAYAFILYFVLLTYNSWYIACFSGVFGLIYIIVYLVRLKLRGINVLNTLKCKAVPIWKDILGYAATLIILYIPFVIIYIPVMRMSNGYSYGSCVRGLPELIDFFNVGETNLLMGAVLKKIGISERGYSAEVTQGFSIVLLMLFFSLFYTFMVRENSSGNSSKHAANVSDNYQNVYIGEIIAASFIAIIIGMMLIVRLSSNGVSLWYFVYTFLPVVRSMRAVARFMLWLSFPMAVVTSYAADKYIKGNFATIALCVILFISNIDKVGVNSRWNAADEMLFLSQVAEPPSDIESFYIIDSENNTDPKVIYQLDAFEIATKYNISTINGYSGQSPKGWGGIWEVSSDTYERKVFDWIERYDLQNVYVYDRGVNIWEKCEERLASLKCDNVFCPEQDRFSVSLGLEDWKQGPFAWTGKYGFKTRIENNNIKNTGMNIKIGLPLGSYMKQNPELEPYLHIYVDGELVKSVDVENNETEFIIPMNSHDGDLYEVEFKTNCYFNPKKIGQNNDTRDLSVAVYYIGD